MSALTPVQKRTLAILDKYGKFILNPRYNNFINVEFPDSIALSTAKALVKRKLVKGNYKKDGNGKKPFLFSIEPLPANEDAIAA